MLRDYFTRLVAQPESSEETAKSPSAAEEETEPEIVGESSIAESHPGVEAPVEFHTQFPGFAETAPPEQISPPHMLKVEQANKRSREGTPITDPDYSPRADSLFIIPAWVDLKVTSTAAGGIDVSSVDSRFGASAIHVEEFSEGFARELESAGYHTTVAKLRCPWKISTPEYVGTRYGDIPMHEDKFYKVFDGMYNTNYFNDPYIILAFEKRHGGYEKYINKGDPLFTVHPYARLSPNAEVKINDEGFWGRYHNTFPQVRTKFNMLKSYFGLDPEVDFDDLDIESTPHSQLQQEEPESPAEDESGENRSHNSPHHE